MSEIDDILAALPMGQIAAELGVDEADAEAASRAALPALLGGLQANAADEAGALSLGRALAGHDDSLLGADLSAVDVQDGRKIVGHIFGDQTSDVVSTLGGLPGTGGSGLIGKLLPILAPIVLSYLARSLGQGGGGGLGSILGSILGGAGARMPSPRGGSTADASPGSLEDILGGSGGGGGQAGGLGDILGDVLGGALGQPSQSQQRSQRQSAQPDAGSIIDILGGLLGGGRR